MASLTSNIESLHLLLLIYLKVLYSFCHLLFVILQDLSSMKLLMPSFICKPGFQFGTSMQVSWNSIRNIKCDNIHK